MVLVKIILDERRKKDLSPVKIRITFNRQQKYYSTGENLSKEDFLEVMKNNPPKRFQDLRIRLDHLELKAKKIIAKIEVFSFAQFEEAFFSNNKAGKNVFESFEQVIKQKLSEGKISTGSNYQSSMNSLKQFSPKLSYIDITPVFLKKFEQYLRNNNKSISTVGIYLRPLRAIINEAIANKVLPLENYPFGRRKYIIIVAQMNLLTMQK